MKKSLVLAIALTLSLAIIHTGCEFAEDFTFKRHLVNLNDKRFSEDKKIRDAAESEIKELWVTSAPKLLSAVDGNFPDIRSIAIDIVNNVLPEREILLPILIKSAKDTDIRVRLGAFFTLWNIRSDARPAMGLMIESLKDENPSIRKYCAEGLSSFGSDAKAAIPSLINLLDDNAPTIRKAAVEALAKIDPSRETAEHLLKLLNDEDPIVRGRTAQALGGIGENGYLAIPHLIEMLDDEDDFVGANAAMGLAWYRKIPSVYAPELAKALEELNIWYERGYLIHALASIGPEQEVINALIKELNGKELNRMGPSARGVEWAAYYLGEFGPKPGVFDALVNALGHSNFSVKEEAARALGKLGLDAEIVLPHLIQALNDDCALAWVGAADALAKYGPEALPTLGRLKEIAGLAETGKIIPEGKKPDVMMYYSGDYHYEEVAQIAAAYAIAMISPDDKAEALQLLRNGLDHGSSGIRAKVIERLPLISHEPEIISMLIKALDDEDERTRRMAVVALGNIGEAAKPALPKLEDLADDYFTMLNHSIAGSDNYRDAAREAIEKITGKPYQIYGDNGESKWLSK